jgi:hypothetical protein
MTALKLASLNANVPSDSGVGLGTVGPASRGGCVIRHLPVNLEQELGSLLRGHPAA